jgi:dipeptidyl aminopeptidase/acylaminoacyl peptidase
MPRSLRIVFPVLLALTQSAGLAAQDRRPSSLSPADIFQLEYAADPAISPDGAWIAYVRRWSDPMTDRRYSNIWVVKRDGSGQYFTREVQRDSPAWSPDGTRLALRVNRAAPSSGYAGWTLVMRWR